MYIYKTKNDNQPASFDSVEILETNLLNLVVLHK